MYSRNILDLRPNATDGGDIAVDETLEAEAIEIRPPASHDACVAAEGRREELQEFLVSCFLASVSIETMTRQLGIDEDTIRSELHKGIQAWNARQLSAFAATASQEPSVIAPGA